MKIGITQNMQKSILEGTKGLLENDGLPIVLFAFDGTDVDCYTAMFTDLLKNDKKFVKLSKSLKDYLQDVLRSYVVDCLNNGGMDESGEQILGCDSDD